MGGEAEVRLSDGTRCDIILYDLAIEVDWAKKWPEAVGQCLHYSRLVGKRPGILLLTRGKPTEDKYLDDCRNVCRMIDITMLTWSTKPTT